MSAEHVALVRRFSEAAGMSPPARSPAELVGLFQAFRPDGDGLSSVMKELRGGDEVLKRLFQIYAASADAFRPGQAYFEVSPGRVHGEDASSIARRHLQGLEVLLQGDDELLELLRDVSVAYESDLSGAPVLEGDDDPSVWLFDAVSDVLLDAMDRSSPLVVLRDAAFSIANDVYLAAFVLWPLYTSLGPADPLAPSFELWAAGLEVRFFDEHRCVVGPAGS